MTAYDNYNLTENGLVPKFQQGCGCSAEGPGSKCAEGKALYKKYENACGAYEEGKITLLFLDTFLEKWQTHLGA